MIEEWIEKLKVGDEIICGYPGTGDIIKTVNLNIYLPIFLRLLKGF